MLPINRIIAVVLILLLIVAFVIIYTFRTGTQQLETFGEARNFCGTTGKASCDSVSELPLSWEMGQIQIKEDSTKTCKELMECSTCQECGFI
jgi:hypothetical protein